MSQENTQHMAGVTLHFYVNREKVAKLSRMTPEARAEDPYCQLLERIVVRQLHDLLWPEEEPSDETRPPIPAPGGQ